jgi:hypothetical protein
MFVYVLIDTVNNQFSGLFTDYAQVQKWVTRFDGYHIVSVEIPLPDTNA